MSLKTYDRNPLREVIDPYTPDFVHCDEVDKGPLRPGDWVSHNTYKGKGMIVAVNDDQITILWSEEPLPGFDRFVMPIMRRVFPTLVAHDLVKIQPMTAPAGAIFYLDYTYGAQEDKRCTEGPLVSRMWWRLVRWARSTTQRYGSYLRSCWRSLRSRLTNTGSTNGYEKRLAEKWSKGLRLPL